MPTLGYGRPLFSQISAAATSSAVGAYSLRSVNGATAKAVNVNVRYPLGTFSTYTTVYGIASASSEYPPGGDNPFAWKAFDGLTASPNYWASGANYTQGIARTTGTVTVAGGTNYYGDWLQIQLPVSFVPTGYALTLQQGRVNAPGTWYVFGSTDGSTWTLLDTRSGIAYTSFTDQQASTFQITGATTSYSYYRIVCNIVSFNTSFALAEFVVLRSADFWADRLGNLLTAPVTGQRLQDWLGGLTGYVSTWYDQSPRGNNAVQGTLANQPTISGSAVNWGGTTGVMLNATNGSNTNAFTLVFLINESVKTWSQFFSSAGTWTTGSLHLLSYITREIILALNPSPNTNTGFSFTDNQNFIVVFTGSVSGGTASVSTFINGTSYPGISSGSVTSFSLQSVNLGNWDGDTGRTLNGSMNNVFMFNYSIGQTDRQLIEGWLAWKNNGSGSILPPSHPYYSTAPVGI